MSNLIRLFLQTFTLLSIAVFLTGCDTTMFTPLSALNSPFAQPIPENQHTVAEMTIAPQSELVLQNALPFYQNAVNNPWPMITANVKWKPGLKNHWVLVLRERLKATHDLNPDDDSGLAIYDKSLIRAVKHFQARNGLTADGIVGKATLYELNIPPAERLHQIEVNIERFIKLSRQLGDRYIMVNIPDYRLYLVDHGMTLLTMKAVVGKPERPTPELSGTVRRLVLNPYWNVPQTIADKDIVPKVLQNPDYLDDNHIRIFDRQEDDATELGRNEVDWREAEVSGFPYHLRQEPGNDNALGLVKFEFPNTKDIYLHDTPAKNLFAENKRAFSSGCIRLEKPFELVSYLMEPDGDWDEDTMEEILDSGKTRYIKIPTPTKIVITYLTVWADDNGNLQFRDDIYGWDNLIE